MRLFITIFSLFVLVVGCFCVSSAQAIDLSNGLMYAVPAPNGPPAFDGTDKGWDLSAAEPAWMSAQMAKELHAKLAVNYDADNLYIYVKATLPGRKLTSPGGPADSYWVGDGLQMHLCSDPTAHPPLSMQNLTQLHSPQICQLYFWKNTLDGKDHITIRSKGIYNTPGRMEVNDPPSAKIKVTEGDNEYLMQVQLPWAAVNVPGGKNPFAPGTSMTAIFQLHWASGTYFTGLPVDYVTNPGDFPFRQWQDWGKIEFSPKGNLPPHHQTMEEALAAAVPAAPVGVPITIDVPDSGKISVNILDDKGAVIRELTGGQSVKPGKFTTYWDGRDQWGFAEAPGKYHWGAYMSHGMKARYIGMVGTSGNPPYPSEDGNGGWGGDHGVPTSTAADASGIYLGWIGSEAQRQIVKIDYQGNTRWRKSPYISGGWGSLYAMACNGKYLFLVYNGAHPVLSRLDPITGSYALFQNVISANGSTVPISATEGIAAPQGSLPAINLVNKDGTAPECLGLAASAKELFASVYSQNLIQVLDAETGQPTRTLTCPGPRGLALDTAGNLYVACCANKGNPAVLLFEHANGDAKPVVTSDLVAPVGVAVDAKGQIIVTDEGASQQIKFFTPAGRLSKTLGKQGGRPRAGTYDQDSYLDPTAIVTDVHGGVIVAESSIPKIFDRIDLASGKTLQRWFGSPGYGVTNAPDPSDPLLCYYQFEPIGFARARIPDGGGNGYPTAYWVTGESDVHRGVDLLFGSMPIIRELPNGKKYLVQDTDPHNVSLIDGDNILPVGQFNILNAKDRRKPELQTPTIDMWIDRNGDHQPQAGETKTITQVQGKPLPNPIALTGNSMWMDKDGSVYFLTANSVLKIPAEGFESNGAIDWNPDHASYVVPVVLPSFLNRAIGGRQGMPGIRIDSSGNLYTCLSTNAPALTPDLAAKIKTMYPDIPQSQWCAYADADLAAKMKEGLGHTSDTNAAKFAKFGPDGKMIWITGRKATSEPNPGEIYHFWALAGLVGDNYVAGASEWGPIYFYTSDGYYVDSIMEDPATLSPPGPYTFGSETFSGRIEAFDKLGKVYAYDMGGVYEVDGFGPDLKVTGEHRFSGTVDLDKVYQGVEQSTVAQGLSISPISGDVTQDAIWSALPKATLVRAGAALATVQMGYDQANLYARVHVVDSNPLRNSADDPSVIFKGGDVVGLDLGPATKNNAVAGGDVRILAANFHAQPRLVAMKPISNQAKKPQNYMTLASGTKNFDFVGDIPNGSAALTPDADGKGYTALITVPRGFLEFPLSPGTTLKGDVEVLLSGVKSQGIQAVSRNWLFSGGHDQTTMTDDIPTEAWLYPQFWGDVSLK